MSELETEADNGYLPRAIRTSVDIPRHRREKWQKEAKELQRATKNGYNDPLSHLLLIDTLMRLKPYQLIRASNLRDLLSELRPQVIWDSVTVGRILNKLTDLAFENRTAGRPVAITRNRDREGTYFRLDPDRSTYAWLGSLREEASTIMTEEKRFESRGVQPPTRKFSVWEAMYKGSMAFGAGGLGAASAAIVLVTGMDLPEILAAIMRLT